MYSRGDYGFLLDNLKNIHENYSLNIDGKVLNKNGEIVEDKQIIINAKFCTLYYIAYKNVAEVLDGYHIDNISDGLINRALGDYETFNSFINNCICEYRMYKYIGSGNILYFPRQELADCFFQNINTRKVLTDYLNCELQRIIYSGNLTDAYNQIEARVKR